MRNDSVYGLHNTLLKYGLAVILGILLFFSTIGQTMAEEHADVDLKVIDEKASLMYDLVKDGKYEEAKQLHEWMAVHFPSVSFDDYAMNTNQMSELFRAFDRAGESVTKAELSEQRRIQYIFAFRLAVDAVISKENPLWEKSAERLLLSLDGIEKQVKQEDPEAARQSFQDWQLQFEMIRPAIYAGVEEKRYMPFISYVRYLDHHSGWVESKDAEEVRKLKSSLHDLLSETEEQSSADPSLWLVMMSIGSAIFVSLTYVGWRKYKGEKQRQHLRD
ncbi:sporulation protein YpjB [Alteribacillus sp. YIM 98480]|uniref:sporulation protein YpjB n=1 Tax=Alteribacillus sp. YIM 98480 TaxID=2606599 RepID=UPI00131A64B6|nr:sporulation protein YpjB [Alteribacillus sp. YIM 98480]